MSKAVYDRIQRYVVHVICEQPLHVGSADGEREDILRHPSTGQPFVQASGIAGVLADYVQKAHGEAVCRQLFGDSGEKNGLEGKSRVVVLDGHFVPGTIKLEMRTRCALNKSTGSVDAKYVKGSDIHSGTLLTAEYIGTGSELIFTVLVYGSGYEKIEDAFAALHVGKVRLGGQNTSGFGRVSVQKILASSYDMTVEDSRKEWAGLIDFYKESGTDLTEEIRLRSKCLKDSDYTICVHASLNTALLIKANMINEARVTESLGKIDQMPDVMNITNAKNEYIIPGTSLKGVFRSRIESIGDYLNISEEKIADVFEQRSKILFEDAVIREDCSMQQKRIHLNKISGAVKNKALFSECVTGGKAEILIHVDSARLKQPKAWIAMLLYVIRDLALGAVSLGSGASVGRGFAAVERVEILENGLPKADFSLAAEQDVQDAFVAECLDELKAVS